MGLLLAGLEGLLLVAAVGCVCYAGGFLVFLGFGVTLFDSSVGLFFLFLIACFQLHLAYSVCTLCTFSKHF